MYRKLTILLCFGLIVLSISACNIKLNDENGSAIQATFVSEQTPNDTDDPAIWINHKEPGKSIILGTDKGDSTGGIFVFDLQGKLIPEKSIKNLRRPNNIDIEYGFAFKPDSLIDIAVFTERGRNMIRVLRLPDMKFIDNGGIPVFEDQQDKAPMGVGLFKDITTGKVFAFVSRKSGPKQGYLAQYELHNDSTGHVGGLFKRYLGSFDGGKEIESIAVDDSLGFVYYSDEGYGVKKYYAHPDSSTEELALLAVSGFKEDHEGISIFSKGHLDGYILVSDQQANTFHVFARKSPHNRIAIVPLSTQSSDGSEAVSFTLNEEFPKGIFVAMSEGKTFHLFDWRKIEAAIQEQIEKKR